MSYVDRYFSIDVSRGSLNHDRDIGILLNGEGAAKVAGVSKQAINRLYQRGKLPYADVLYGVVFHVSDVIALYPNGPGAAAAAAGNYGSWWKANKPARRGPKGERGLS